MALYVDATAPNSIAPVVTFGEPKTNASGGKNIAIFKDRAILTYAGPTVRCYGIGVNQFDAAKPASYDITLQLDESPESMSFIQNMLALERRILDEANKNSFKWFGRKLSPEVLNEFWTPFVKYPKKKGTETGELDMSKSPTVRFKFAHFDGQFKYIEVYNTSNELIFPKPNVSLEDLIPKGSEVKGLFRCNGIWFAGGKFGMTCKPIQLVVRPKARILPGVCQLTMGSSTSSKELEDEEVEPVKPVSNSEMNVSVEDSDDEDPDKEYSSATTSAPEGATGHTETAVSESEAPAAPVKRKVKVNKKDGATV
jgi:hypothetical protein